ncbi:MAG: penicillin-binding protein 1C [Bacteriovoracaceae bacterium]|nr:penicillin-binding protein 1C [Bacteriovoracaceae bacterium]
MENQRLRNSLSKINWFLASALTIFVIADWMRLGSELPSITHSTSQRILDRYGQEIRHSLSINGERRYLITLDQVPDILRDAFIVAEDKNFFSHHGVHWPSLFRGIFQSLINFRKISGGSTITMQLVRIQWPQLKGWIHKPAQILQSLWIERYYSKGEILHQYLNTIPFGNKISGVGAACRYFFNKSCEQLSIGETASLSILPRNPNYFLSHPEKIINRRNHIIEKFFNNSDLTSLKQAKNEPVIFQKSKLDFYAPHLTERIIRETSPTIREINTTIDLELQKYAEQLLYSETLRRKGTGDSGSILVIENDTGEILAYVGGPDFFEESHGMVDGVMSYRSPGSSLKPFVYELALENNWNLFQIIPDIPMTFSTQKSIIEPHNYGGNFSGPRTLRDALGNSKNIPALYLASQLGEAKILERFKKLGFSNLNKNAGHYGIGIALGNAEVNLWDLTQAYSTLARLGAQVPLTYLNRPSIEKKEQMILSQDTSYLIADVLKDPNARREEFGRFGPLEFDYEVGVKTGTSNDFKDNWTIGFTKKITIGVWRGNADSSPLIQRTSAAKGTAPLFHKLMDRIHLHRNPSWPQIPTSIESSIICTLSGKKPGQYCPSTRTEFHLRGNAPKVQCDFHKQIVVEDCLGKKVNMNYVELPNEYTEWSTNSIFPTLKNQLAELCNQKTIFKNLSNMESQSRPYIVTPIDHSSYAIDPHIPYSHQLLRISVRNVENSEKLILMINESPQNIQMAENTFSWPLKRGNFKFQILNGKLVSNEINIQVR